MDEGDERFSHIKNDPRFRAIPRKEKKIEIDKRFASMFHDKRFKVQFSMDKRGRPLQSTTSEDLRKYYEVNSSESENESEGNEFAESCTKPEKKLKPTRKDTKQNVDFKKKKKKPLVPETSSDDSGNDEPKIDLARGEGNVESSSSDTSSEEDEESGVDDDEWGKQETDVSGEESISHRLAVCNMDWDRIKARDLFVLFNNFKPANGNIKSVKIYPSEFGAQRMKEEEVRGPQELTETTLASDEEDYTETKEGSKYHMETLRKYQLNRLRYYYAVVDCDSPGTANALYTELDGMEYESSASQLDLRFIPDNETFEQEPSSIADKLPDMSTYEPILFTTKALQQTMVELTWDETNPNRLRTLERAFNEEEENQDDIRAYLASSSSSEAEDDDVETNIVNEEKNEKTNSKGVKSRIAKYKDLLASLEEEEDKKKNKDIQMEITWEPGLKDKAESLLKTKQQNEDMTCFEEYLKKKKEKKKQQHKDKKVEKEESVKEDLCEDDELPSDIDLTDPFFQEELNFKGQKPKKFKKKQEVVLNQDDISKGELELLLMEDGENKKHFNLKNLVEEASMSKRKKRKLNKMEKKGIKAKKEDEFQIDTEDPRFSALFSSADFNIDPSDTHFKKTKAMEALLQEKHKRRRTKLNQKEETNDAVPKTDSSLSGLIKAIKNKTNNYQRH